MVSKLEKALNATKESKNWDFKQQFDPSNSREWCEIIKDIVAMANSGGGLILVGLKNDGSPSGVDVTPILDLDPADVTNKISPYIGEQFDGFEVLKVEKDCHIIAVLKISGTSSPMVFERPGSYTDSAGKQQSAFMRGTVYFRHGAKSEPGTTKDLEKTFARLLRKTRRSWLANIRKVVEAPDVLTAVPTNVAPQPIPGNFRIVDDPSAPSYGLLDTNQTHPYRQTEVIEAVNTRLLGKQTVNPHDILSVRRVHGIDETKPGFCYKLKFGSPIYSKAFIDWLIEQYSQNPGFFNEARAAYNKLLSHKS